MQADWTQVGQAGGSPDASVISNTIARNCNRGLTIGTSRAASPNAVVRTNIVQDNAAGTEPPLGNIKVFTTPPSEAGYAGDVLPRDLAAGLETRGVTGTTRDAGRLDRGYRFPLR